MPQPAGDASSGPVLPGATIGLLGGGQLGRMTALAARAMGYDVHVLDPDPAAPASALASHAIRAPLGDADAVVELARRCAVLMPEIETISADGMARAIGHAPVRPGATVLHVVQDRIRQKRWLATHGFPLAPFRVLEGVTDARDAAGALRGPCYVKRATGGYDGRGQLRTRDPAGIEAAWTSLGAAPCVAEEGVDIALELSVLVARSPSGVVAAYPPAANHHIDGILAWSVIPGVRDPALAAAARALATDIAGQLDVHGLLCVEMFLDTGGALLVNELAPRPHNSYHASVEGCVTGQFEQAVRAVCDLPLGDPGSRQPAAIANLLGELWPTDGPLPAPLALRDGAAKLHLYGKREARPGRKMGHVAAVGDTPGDAVERAVVARNLLAARGGAAAWDAAPWMSLLKR